MPLVVRHHNGFWDPERVKPPALALPDLQTALSGKRLALLQVSILRQANYLLSQDVMIEAGCGSAKLSS